MNVAVSDIDCDQLEEQVRQAIVFLEKHHDELQRLSRYPGVERVLLDFGVEALDVAVQTDGLPPQLLRLAGELGIWVELSRWV